MIEESGSERSGSFRGSMRKNKRHGPGEEQYPNGDVYRGDFFDGLRHGNGRIEFADGGYYQGEWFQGEKHGLGTLETPAAMYKGSFV